MQIELKCLCKIQIKLQRYDDFNPYNNVQWHTAIYTPSLFRVTFKLLCRRLFLALKGLKKKRLLSCIFFVYYKHLFNLLQFEVKNKKS